MRAHLSTAMVVCLSMAAASRAALAASPNGSAGAMSAYYDGHLFLINFKELSDAAAQALLSHNGSINKIFRSEDPLPGGAMFVSVLDAIQGDGFNPLWQEFDITFTAGHVPRQLLSDNDVAAAAAAGEIKLTRTGEVYRCAVIGPKVADHSPNPNGAGGEMPAYYDGTLFRINFKQMSKAAAQALLAHNGSINVIYRSEDPLPGGGMFLSVLDAIQGDGFNPLWQEVEITFNAGHQPRQLVRDDEVLAARSGGEITLTLTGEVYRCSVIGPK